MNEQPHAELIARWIDAETRGDMEALLEVWHQDIREIFPGRSPVSSVYEGREALKAFYENSGGMVEELEMLEVTPLAYGDKFVLMRNRERIKIKGRSFELDRHLVAEVRDGLIYEVRIHEFDQYATDEFFTEVLGAA